MRTLAIRPGAIGDLILSLPALECLKSDFMEVWTAGPTVPLVRFADRVRSIPATGLDLLGIVEPLPALLRELRSFDRIVSWYGTNRPDFIELTRTLGLPFEFLRALPPEGGGLHAADFYFNQVAALGAAERPLPDGRGSDRSRDREGGPHGPRGATKGDEEALAGARGMGRVFNGAVVIPRILCPGPRRNFAVIHPFSGGARKNWPLAKFQALARAIGRTMPVEWCAGPDDPPLDGTVRILDLYELACWLAKARLYIGNDSGITHLAAAAGAPVLALFGPTDPAVWAPRGPQVRVVRWV